MRAKSPGRLAIRIAILSLVFAPIGGTGYAEAQNRLIEKGTAIGSFCDRLRHILVQGTSGEKGRERFRDIQGERLERDNYVGLVKLPGATRCEIHGDFHKPKYWCYFSDGPRSERGRLLQEFRQLESQIDACLVRTDWPSLELRSRADPGRRYDKSVGSDQVTYFDRYQYHQNVQLTGALLAGSSGEGLVNVMWIEGR